MMILRRDRTYWRNLMLFTAGCLLVGLLVVLVLFSYRSAYMYTHPVRRERPPGETPSRLGIAYQDVVLQTADGLQLAAWYTPSENGALILVAHGYGEYRMPEIYALFARHGYGVLAWDFRAHGESQGDLSSLGYYETLDFEAALDFASDQPGVRHVGAWGGSMGAATLVRAAARQPQIAAVVLDSAFPAIEEELAQVVRLAIARPLIRWFAEWQTGLSMDRLRPVDEIGMISPRPVLIIQGLADTMIPSDSAARLYAAAGEPRMLWLEPEIGHMAMLGALPQAYERRVIEFFDAVFVGR